MSFKDSPLCFRFSWLSRLAWSFLAGLMLLGCWDHVAWAQTRPLPPPSLARMWGSAADNDRPTALATNPAGLAFQPAWGLHYLHTDVGDPGVIGRGEGDALFLSFKPFSFFGLGFGVQVLYPEPATDPNLALGTHLRATMGGAFRLGTLLSLGFNTHVLFGDNPEVQSLLLIDAGLIFRPWNFLSLGVMARNLNAPRWGETQTYLTRTWELGVAIRPLLNDRVVLSADFRIPETGQDLAFAYRLEFEPVRGWLMGFRVTHSLPVQGVGLEAFLGFRFGQFGIRTMGAMGLQTSPEVQPNWAGWTAALWYSGSNYSSLARPRGKMPLLDIAGSLPERTHSFPFGGSRAYFMRLILAIERARKDPQVSGMLLRIGGLRCGLAKVQEVRQALLRFKKAKKKLLVYLTSADLKSYYLASIADKIYLNPVGSLWVTGLATQHMFLADALKKVGIKPQFVKFGKYKTGPNMFTKSKMTPAHKEASSQLLDDLFGQVSKGLAQARKVSAEKVKQWFKKGLFAAKQAQEAGLVDDIFYWDSIWKNLRTTYGDSLRLDAGYFRRSFVPSRWKGLSDAIAVIHVDGAIVSGSNVDDPLFGVHLSGASTIIRYLIRAQYDSRIKAVVLRINSPGGEVMASDMIWRYVSLLRQVKPVVVSMGAVAASGGYYIAAPANTIVASPATVTGSIGIYAGKFDFSGLLKKLGVNISIQKRGTMAGFFNSYASWTPEQRKIFREHIKIGYEQFLEKVGEGRKMKVKAVDKVAQGRVWSGTRAKTHKLVDRIGGIWTALQEARKLVGLPADVAVAYVSWPDQSSWRLAPLRALGFSTQTALPSAGPQDPLAKLFTNMGNALSPRTNLPVLGQVFSYWKQLVRRLHKPQLWAITSQTSLP